MHGSELSDYSRGAEGDSELVTRLLNWYYTDEEAAEHHMHPTGGESAAKQTESMPEVIPQIRVS